jgi:hypothetical protein
VSTLLDWVVLAAAPAPPSTVVEDDMSVNNVFVTDTVVETLVETVVETVVVADIVSVDVKTPPAAATVTTEVLVTICVCVSVGSEAMALPTRKPAFPKQQLSAGGPWPQQNMSPPQGVRGQNSLVLTVVSSVSRY